MKRLMVLLIILLIALSILAGCQKAVQNEKRTNNSNLEENAQRPNDSADNTTGFPPTGGRPSMKEGVSSD